MPVHDETTFESEIADALTGRGWELTPASAFDHARLLAPAPLLAFVKESQPKAWSKLVGMRGGDEVRAENGLLDRIAQQADERGVLDCLRRPVDDLGVKFRLLYPEPASNASPDLVARYESNRLTVIRQLRPDAATTDELDLCLLVNGLPVATAELKNPFTHQTARDAIRQYREDRDPRHKLFTHRTLVHFAVDPDEVFVTTRLAAADTRFLPFNLGRDDGAGNPANPDGHRTAYLWERVWDRGAWIDLIARFIQRSNVSGTIFPRLHQWSAVRELEAAARADGPGRSYLVQHSAGSGKSNTIAWLAHRLATLHDASDQPVFDQVVVVTDRRVLDRQLQDTVFQFEHSRGFIVRIDRDSNQLAGALASGEARIVITTLQKFPVVFERSGKVEGRRFAVIVDEAHSSQTGDAAGKLKAVLGAGSEKALADAEAADAAAQPPDAEDLIAQAVAARGRQPNLSFFAFTATPKARTLEVFGERDSDGLYRPFHLYSMRQAIDEEFILDVLANYTTYATFYRVEKAVLDDPELPRGKASSAIARYVSLHPTNLDQRAQIIVDHFRTHVRHLIGGRAKAMVVTRSRLHAVRTYQALRRHIATCGYDDVGVLVAFSGTVTDEGGLDYTEPGLNGFGEAALADYFNGPDAHLLVVAEKYQTGFDQPLLQAMYVDKPLAGVHAVQTLSRLNRIHPGKERVFVLDFANDADAIAEAFAPFYRVTLARETDPNDLFDAQRRVLEAGVIDAAEARVFAETLLRGGRGAHASLYALADRAVERYHALPSVQERTAFRDHLDRFVRLYAFLSQIVPYVPRETEETYLLARYLAPKLRDDAPPRVDVSDQVRLSHLRIEGRGAESPEIGEAEPLAATGGPSGGAAQPEPPTDLLSRIVAVVNERFQINFSQSDLVLLSGQVMPDALADPELQASAAENPLDTFAFAWDRVFMRLMLDRLERNEEVVSRITENGELFAYLRDELMREAYAQLRAGTPSQKHAGDSCASGFY